MAKKYKCPYCNERYEREKLISHIDKKHEDLIPEDYTSARLVFNMINKRDHGECRVCHAETKWNEKAGRYDVLCGKPSCKETMRKQYENNMLRVRGTTNILNDPEQQQKMLANRKISGKYKFADGALLTYTGSYERKCLEFLDKVLQIPSKDILAPGPTLEYMYEGKHHFYITDMLLIPYNLIVEIKDGGSNPNNKATPGMIASREKTIAKEKLITDKGEYNYVRLTDNNFAQLMEVLMDIKLNALNGNDDKVININEVSIYNKNFTQEELNKQLDEIFRDYKKPNMFQKIYNTTCYVLAGCFATIGLTVSVANGLINMLTIPIGALSFLCSALLMSAGTPDQFKKIDKISKDINKRISLYQRRIYQEKRLNKDTSKDEADLKELQDAQNTILQYKNNMRRGINIVDGSTSDASREELKKYLKESDTNIQSFTTIDELLDNVDFNHIYLSSDWHIYKERFSDQPNEIDWRTVIKNYKSIVRDNDVFIYLGDCCYRFMDDNYKEKVAKIFKSLKGVKILVLGNHDIFADEYFYNKCGFKFVVQEFTYKNMVFTHKPIDMSLYPDGMINIHGHIHKQRKYFVTDGKDNINVYPSKYKLKPVTLQYLINNKQTLTRNNYHQDNVLINSAILPTGMVIKEDITSKYVDTKSNVTASKCEAKVNEPQYDALAEAKVLAVKLASDDVLEQFITLEMVEEYTVNDIMPSVITESSNTAYNDLAAQQLAVIIETKRSELKDSDFGVPEERKYPLDSPEHVRSAIKFFNYVKPQYEEELARNLKRAMKKYNIDVKVGENNRFKKYLEESVNENMIISTNDIKYNVDQWKVGGNNLLLITGLSGSGKTTEASKLAKDNNAIVFELDKFEFNDMIFNDKNPSEGDIIIRNYITSNYGGEKDFSKMGLKAFWKEREKLMQYLLDYTKSHKNRLFIMEGVQISSASDQLINQFKTTPCIIKGASATKSLSRRLKRDLGNIDCLSTDLKHLLNLIKYYRDGEKHLNYFKDNMNESQFVIDRYRKNEFSMAGMNPIVGVNAFKPYVSVLSDSSTGDKLLDRKKYLFSTDIVSDKYLTVNHEGKLEIIHAEDIPGDAKVAVYEYVGNDYNISKIYRAYHDNCTVSRDFIYTALSGKPLLSNDQISMDEHFRQFDFDALDETYNSIAATFNYQYSKVSNTMDMSMLEFAVANGANNNGIEIKQNLNGYYYHNTANDKVTRTVGTLAELTESMLNSIK